MSHREPAAPIVALLSDFGASVYSGVMKGVILRQAPAATLVDITHNVSPHNVREGAWLLAAAVPWFPAGTIFLVVVDPGVGTRRQALAVEAAGCRFVAPDNGVLWPALQQLGGPELSIALPVPAEASTTFHGRDLFAPAAGALAAGRPLEALGPRVRIEVKLTFHRAGRTGEVVFKDPFGNLVTNLQPVEQASTYKLSWDGGSQELPLLTAYGAAAALDVDLFAVTGSSGTLEISRYQAPAAEMLDLAPGDRVKLEPTS